MKIRYIPLLLMLLFTNAFASNKSGYFYDPKIKHEPEQNEINLYGPGGPHTGLIKVAEAYNEMQDKVKVVVNYGPEYKWSKEAQKKADIIFGASEQSMTAYLENYHFVKSQDVKPIYIREAVIALNLTNLEKDNKKIKNFKDLLKPGIKVVVTEGKGTYNTSGTGLWEDIAGRKGKLSDIQNLRKNIVGFEQGSGAGFKAFKKSHAWITWIDWPISQKNNKEVKIEYIRLPKDRRIYRDLNIAVSNHSKEKAKGFVEFLNSKEGEKLMGEFGWKK